jgi:hypothetical protein
MGTCKICNLEFKNLKSLSGHFNSHHKLTSKEYYDLYLLKELEGKCSVCNNDTTFRNLGVGYLKTCSLVCSLLDKDNREKRSESRKGKPQSKDTINKRINNTNQQLKELNRKNTMINKYGVDNPMKLSEIKNKVSDKLKGVKRPRTDEWQQNIIESKRKNNTLSHSTETKDKIRNCLNEHYEKNLDRDKYIVTSNNVKHLSGWYNNLYFRSSLELSFLVNNPDKTFLSCEIKKYVVSYSVKGKIKSYYPDYTDGEFIYEIKPASLLTFGHNQHKIRVAKEMFGEKYKIITEQESDYITKDIIKKLIANGDVVLAKYSEEIFNRYKY